MPIGAAWERALDGAALEIVDFQGVPLRMVEKVGQVPCWFTALILLPRWGYDLLLDVAVDETGRPMLVGVRVERLGEEKRAAFQLERRWPVGEYPDSPGEFGWRLAVRDAWTPLSEALEDFPITVLDGLVRVAVAKAAHRLLVEQRPELRAVLPELDQDLIALLAARVRTRRRRDPITSSKLQEAADLYRRFVQDGRTNNPTERVATAMNVSRTQASRYLRQARERGYLGKARRSTAGERE